MPTTIPIKDANGNTVSMVVNPAYDPQDDMVKMKSLQKKWRDSFTVAGPPDPAKWDVQTLAGGSASIVSAGTLTLTSGSVSTGETAYVLSKETFTIPFRASVGMTLSSRVAGHTFRIEAVSVDPSTGLPDGQHSIAWAFEGTTATQAIYEVQNGGLARLRSGASTVVTTASNGVYELEPFADEAWFHSTTLDAVTARANSYRRHRQIPDPNALFKIKLGWTNATNISSANAVIEYISVQDYAELTAEVTAGRGNSVAGNAMSVTLAGATAATTAIGTVAISASTNLIGDVGLQYRANATGAATVRNIVSAASTNATNLKTAAGRVVGFSFANTTAAWRYVKLHNATTNPPVAGTTAVAMTISVPPNGVTNNAFEGGLAFGTGLGFTIVTGSADSDSNAVGAGDVVGQILYV